MSETATVPVPARPSKNRTRHFPPPSNEDEVTLRRSPTYPHHPVLLPGLRIIMNQRKIERKVLARQLDFDLNRFLGIVGLRTRAAPAEVEKLLQQLNVSIDHLLSETGRTTTETDQTTTVCVDEGEATRTIAASANEVTLHIVLPDGRKYSVSSNQPASALMLERMSKALWLLV